MAAAAAFPYEPEFNRVAQESLSGRLFSLTGPVSPDETGSRLAMKLSGGACEVHRGHAHRRPIFTLGLSPCSTGWAPPIEVVAITYCIVGPVLAVVVMGWSVCTCT